MPSTRRFPPPWSVEDIGAVHVVKGCNQTAKPPTKEKADGFALSPQNGAVVLSQRRRWGHRTDGAKFTFASHPGERSTRRGRPVRLRKDSTNLTTTRSLGGDLFSRP